MSYSRDLLLRMQQERIFLVRAPLECGLRLENFNDVKVGDVIESFEIEEIADTL